MLNNIGRLDDVAAAQMAIALTPYRSHLDEASVILGVPDETAGRASAVALTALVAIPKCDVNPAFARQPQHRVLRPLQNKRLARAMRGHRERPERDEGAGEGGQVDMTEAAVAVPQGGWTSKRKRC